MKCALSPIATTRAPSIAASSQLQVDLPQLMFHPVRLRIVHATSQAGVQTTAELADRLADVPRTSIYRNVGLLIDGGVIDVVAERRCRAPNAAAGRRGGDQPGPGETADRR